MNKSRMGDFSQVSKILMRRCIAICWERRGKEAYCEIAGEDPGLAVKPKPREFICAMANYIVRRGEEV